ncbi:uncharacterized protein [Montipora capricornis]|uniref:uncharacterized protein n=1 Tax=Montipora capricornis TaxID=246305 RepID=UPI0035F14338
MTDIVSFVKSLELAEGRGYRAVLTELGLPPGNKQQGYVNDGSLVSFTSNLEGLQKQDVLHSSLLAQLAANKKHDRLEDSKNWYMFYTNVMATVGWDIQSFQFDEYDSTSSTVKVSQVTLKLLSSILGGDEEMMEVIKNTIDKLAKDSQGASLLQSSSSSQNHGNFQVVPCNVDKSNQVNVAFLGCFFRASEVAKDYFFFDYKKEDIHLFKGTQVFTLDQQIYGKVREAVIEKLGDNANTKIHDLHI